MGKKPRLLCLHEFGTSGKILAGEIISRWPKNIVGEFDLVFPDAPFPMTSCVDGFYVWFWNTKDFKEFFKFEECLVFLEDYMIQHGPFDGVLGYSQGACLAASLPGMQKEGVALAKVPPLKFFILIAGAKFGYKAFGIPKIAANAFSSPINYPSLHIMGEHDKLDAKQALAAAFVDPVVIVHPGRHIIPSLNEENLGKMLQFIQTIKKIPIYHILGKL